MEKFIVKQEFIASPSTLFDAFTNHQTLSLWWDGPSSLDLNVGGRFSFAKIFDDGVLGHACGEVLEFERNSRLKLSWAWDCDIDQVSECEITFGSSCSDGISSIRIEHDVSKARNACVDGWTSALLKLYQVPEISEAQFDWTQFRKSVVIDKSREELLSYWIDPKKITKWFVSSAEYFDTRQKSTLYAQEGGTYRWEWADGDSVDGSILQLTQDSLTFTFGTPSVTHGKGLPPVKVTVTFDAVSEGKTEVKLHQFEMPTTPSAMAGWHLSCSTGWTHFLLNLKSVAQFGVNLDS